MQSYPNLIKINLDKYYPLMAVAIMNDSHPLVDYLLSMFSESEIVEYHQEDTVVDYKEPNLDQEALSLAILRNNLYATKSISREHHVDPLEVKFGGRGFSRPGEASEIENLYPINQYDRFCHRPVNYGTDILLEITDKFPIPLWGYLGFKLNSINPPNKAMIDYIFTTVSDNKTGHQIFDFKITDYSKYFEDESISRFVNVESQIKIIIDYLESNLTSDIIDKIFDSLLINWNRSIAGSIVILGIMNLPQISENTRNKIDLTQCFSK